MTATTGTIVLQFAESTSLGGRIIEWYDHGRFAHVDTVLPDGSLLGARDDVVAGIPAGVQIRPADYLGAAKTFQVSLPVPDVAALDYEYFLRQQLGKSYDESAIAGFVFGRNWNKPDSWFCSELVAAGLQQAGILKPLVAPANKIPPDDLLLCLSCLVDIGLPPM